MSPARLIAGQGLPENQNAKKSSRFKSNGWHCVCSTVIDKIAVNSEKSKRMKTSHLKTISACGLAALSLIAFGPASLRAQDAAASGSNGPVYAPIDLSTNAPAAVTVTTNTETTTTTSV